MNGLLRLLVTLCLVAFNHSIYSSLAQAPECTAGCLVAIEGIQSIYSPSSHQDILIRNQSKQELAVDVVIEGREHGSWKEISGSISDPNHAFDKITIASPIRPGASLKLAFNPCATMLWIDAANSSGFARHPCSRSIADGDRPASLRLRVDVFVKGREKMTQRIRSSEFQLKPEQ